MDQDEMMYRLMEEMLQQRERKPVKEKHYGFGLPKSYRVIDAETGAIDSSFGHSEVAYKVATEKQQTGHRFEVHAIWK